MLIFSTQSLLENWKLCDLIRDMNQMPIPFEELLQKTK
jgi:hypothetical protein